MASWRDVGHSMNILTLLTSWTLMTLMMKLTLCFYCSQIHDLTKGQVTRAEPPNSPVVSDLSSSLIGVLGLIPAVLPEAQAGDTSLHLPFARRLVDQGDMSWLQKLNGVDTGGMDWGWPGPLGLMCPLVMAWEINHLPSPRLTTWCWVLPVSQPMQWLLTMWMWYISPHPSSVLLLTNGAHRTRQPSWAYHYGFC